MTLACPTRSSAKAVFDSNVSIRTAAIRHMLITLLRQLSNVAWIEFRPILERLKGWQILGPLGIVKLRATQPAPFEARPEQDRVHLPGKFINSPDTAALYDLPGCVEWQAVEFAKSVDFVPVLSDITVLQRDVVRPVGS